MRYCVPRVMLMMMNLFQNVYNPWGKGYGAPVRDSRGNVINSRKSDGNSINGYENKNGMVG
jgi:hypothetical protein